MSFLQEKSKNEKVIVKNEVTWQNKKYQVIVFTSLYIFEKSIRNNLERGRL